MKKTIFLLATLLVSVFIIRIKLVSSEEGIIQSLIDDASWGDTVYLPTGIYYENVWVNKSLTVIGDSTTIKGDSGWGTIGVWRTENVILKNLIIEDSFDGIYIGASNHCTVENCIFSNLSGCALEFESSEYCIARNVTIQTAFGGFYLDLSHECIVENCTIQNTRYAINTLDARNNTIKNNIIKNNYTIDFFGIGNSIIGNRFENTEANALHIGGSNNTVEDNIFVNNYMGVYVACYSYYNTFYNNTFIKSTWSNMQIHLSHSNLIYYNNFFKGTGEQVILEGDSDTNFWNNTKVGNYWSDYKGRDLYSGINQNETGSDGIGDTPYIISGSNIDHYPLMTDPTPFDSSDIRIPYDSCQGRIVLLEEKHVTLPNSRYVD